MEEWTFEEVCYVAVGLWAFIFLFITCPLWLPFYMIYRIFKKE